MKKNLHKKVFTFLAILGLGTMQLSAQIVGNTETFSSSLNGWDQNFGTNGTVTWADAASSGTADGALKLVRLSNNANFGFKLTPEAAIGINADVKKVIKVRYKNGTKANQIRIGGKNGAGVTIVTTDNAMVADPGVNTNGYVTQYIDMSGVPTWSGNLLNFWIGVRQNWVTGEAGIFYIDKIEFLDALPPDTYSEFIKNPGFEDLANQLTHLSGTSPGASRAISTAEVHDGDQSLRYEYTADATANYWAFSNYIGDYTASPKLAGTTVVAKMWIKTNRTTPINVIGRLRTYVGATANAILPSATVTTTNTSGNWEELTFNILCTEAFDGASFWFNLNYDELTPNENLKAGNIVYVDQLSAVFDYSTLGVKQNTLEGVSIYPNPATDVLNVNAPEGSAIEVYNALGAVVKSAKGTNSVSVSDLASGMYLVKVSKDGKSYQTKIIK